MLTIAKRTSVVAVIGTLLSACGAYDGIRTAHEVQRAYDLNEGDRLPVQRLAMQGATAAIRAAARKYIMAISGHSAALLVGSAAEFGARREGRSIAVPNDVGSLLGSREMARSRLLLSLVDAPLSFRSAGLGCVHAYERCIDSDSEEHAVCNTSMLKCLAERVTTTASIPPGD